MLAVSGTLDTTRRPGSLVAEVRSQSVALFGFNKKIPRDLDGCHYRSVYLPVVRDRLPDIWNSSISLNPSLVTGRRDTTNVPVQALYLMNSPFILEQSAALAKKLQNQSNDSKAQIENAYRLCFARAPQVEELRLAQQFLDAQSSDLALPALCQALLSTSEFRNLD